MSKGLIGTGPMMVYGVSAGIPNKNAEGAKGVEEMNFLVAARCPMEAGQRAMELARAVAQKRKVLPDYMVSAEEWALKAVDDKGQVRAA